jgi:hypothetical protein
VVVAAAEWTFTLQIYTSAHFQTVVRWARHWSFLFIVPRLALALSLSLFIDEHWATVSAGTPPVPAQKRVHTRAVACQALYRETIPSLSLPFFFVCVHYIQWSRVKVKTYTYDPPPPCILYAIIWASCDFNIKRFSLSPLYCQRRILLLSVVLHSCCISR